MVKLHFVIELLCYIKPKASSSPKTYGAENLVQEFHLPLIPSSLITAAVNLAWVQ